MRQEFKQRESLRPVDLTIDFSKTGNFEGKFHQAYRIVCGACNTSFFLEVPKDASKAATAPNTIKQLQLNYVISDADGKVTGSYESSFDENSEKASLLQNFPERQLVELFSFQGFLTKNKDYTLTINITKGIPELTGIPQQLFVASETCPTEKLSLGFCSILMLISLSVAAILLFIVGVITIEKKKRTPPTPST